MKKNLLVETLLAVLMLLLLCIVWVMIGFAFAIVWRLFLLGFEAGMSMPVPL